MNAKMFAMLALGLAIALFCGPEAVSADLPQSAADIRAIDPTAPDGVYTIFPNGQMFDVYCHDMAGTPKEYLVLVNTGADGNFGQYTAGGASPGTDVRTNYQMIRLDPATLLVDIGDQTFAASQGFLYHVYPKNGEDWPVTSMPYGCAMSCISEWNAAGMANIDLRGTPFAVSDTFVLGGWCPAGTAVFSSNDQVVDVTGGGWAGWNTPAPQMYNPFNATGGFRLDLAYIGPQRVPIDIKPGSNPNSFNNDGHGVIPVAILSSDGFDATLTDPATVNLDGASVRVVGKGNTQAHIEDVNGDGLQDLVVQIEDMDGIYTEGETIAVLHGETFGGEQFCGADWLRIVPPN